ncbi:hypothetical protein JOD43_002411 [Pullulanibacillus pueri]|nr:hypothetical protein [Pullulanibacillus pueri]
MNRGIFESDGRLTHAIWNLSHNPSITEFIIIIKDKENENKAVLSNGIL